MISWLEGQLDFLLFLHGLALVWLAVSSWLLSRVRRQTSGDCLSWSSLTVFGMANAGAQWVYMLRLSLQWPELVLVHLVLAAAGFVSLLQFVGGHKHGPRQGWQAGATLAALVVAIGWGWWFSPRAVAVAVHQIVGAAALLTAGGFLGWRWWRRERGRRWLGATAGALVLYGLANAMLDPHATPGKTETFGVQLGGIWGTALQTLVAALLAMVVARHGWEQRSEGSLRRASWKDACIAACMLLVVLGGWCFADRSGARQAAELADALLERVTMASVVVDAALVPKLRWSEDDLGSPAYQQLKQQMMSLHHTAHGSRFVYLVGYREGRIYFLVDSEPPDSPGYSPPGQYYAEAKLPFVELQASARPGVVGPSTDHWGSWVTGSVPVAVSDGEVVSLCMDYPAAAWLGRVAGDRLIPILITMLVSVLLLALFMYQMHNRETQAILKLSEHKLRGVFNHVYDGIIVHSLDGTIIAVNERMLALYGLTREQALRASIAGDLSSGNNHLEELPKIWEKVVGGHPQLFEWNARRPGDHSEFPVEVFLCRMDLAGGPAIVATIRDITDRREAERRLHHRLEMERLVSGLSSRFVCLSAQEVNQEIVDALGRIGQFTGAERVYVRLLSADGRYLHSTYEWCAPGIEPLAVRTESLDVQEFAWLIEQLRRLEPFQVADVAAMPAEARVEQRSLEAQSVRSLLVIPMMLGRELRGFLGLQAIRSRMSWSDDDMVLLKVVGEVFIHAMERRRVQEKLLEAAHVDKLTGLANRAIFGDRLSQALLRAKRMPDHRLAVLFLDFDRFKLINDSLGHEVGDRLLVEIAQRLRQHVREVDSIGRGTAGPMAARLGGDEFVILLDGLREPADAEVVAKRLLAAFAEPFRLGEHEVFCTVSIGIAVNGGSAQHADELIRNADTAMYEAKLAGKSRYVVFDDSMLQRVRIRLHMENDLRKALEQNRFVLHYQPIVRFETGETVGFEALVRWQHPERGVVPPGEFIPVAEESGLIVPLGEWAVRQACGQLAQWHSLGRDWERLKVSVNVSRIQLVMADFVAKLRSVLVETGIPPQALQLEVTESTVMRDPVLVARVLEQIKELGCGLSMDDFGTGYSSLSCLHQFPLNVLKIDRSFVANLHAGRQVAALVSAIATLAGHLKIDVVAEGVETLDQAIFLHSLDCQFGQGWFFGKPMPPDEAIVYKPPLICEAARRQSA